MIVSALFTAWTTGYRAFCLSSIGKENQAALKIAALAGTADGEHGRNEAAGESELTLAPLDLPTRRARRGAGFGTGRHMTVTQRRKP